MKITESYITNSVSITNRPLFGLISLLLTRNSQRQSYKIFFSRPRFSLTLFAVSYHGPSVLLQAQLSCNRVRQHPTPQLDAERCYYTRTGHEVLWRLRRQLRCQKRWHLRNGTPDFGIRSFSQLVSLKPRGDTFPQRSRIVTPIGVP